MELYKAQNVEDKCLQPLVESRWLKPISTGKLGQKQMPLIQWMKDVQAHLVTNGMDGVFNAMDTKNNMVLNLLESWSNTTVTEVAEWIKTENCGIFMTTITNKCPESFSWTQSQMNFMRESSLQLREMSLDP